jgi:MerR family regulatory protein
MAHALTIGQLAHATGVPAKTIRYYEQVGVLPVPRRSATGYRQYAQRDVHRLLFIRDEQDGLSPPHAAHLPGVAMCVQTAVSKRDDS